MREEYSYTSIHLCLSRVTHQRICPRFSTWFYTTARGSTRQHVVRHDSTCFYTTARGSTRQHVVLHDSTWFYTTARGSTRQHVVLHEGTWFYTTTRCSTRQHVVRNEVSRWRIRHDALATVPLRFPLMYYYSTDDDTSKSGALSFAIIRQITQWESMKQTEEFASGCKL